MVGWRINLDEATCSCRSSNPHPSCQFSVNLNEHSGMAANRWIFGLPSHVTRETSPAMMDDFGPSVTWRLSMPVRSLDGEAVSLGCLGGDALRGVAAKMLMLPLPSPLLTRPL